MLVTSKRVAAYENLGPKGPRLVTSVSDREEKDQTIWCRALQTTEGSVDFIAKAVGSSQRLNG